MTQEKLARLMGVSLEEVARRIAALLALFDKNNLPHPILVKCSGSGVVTYHVNPTQKSALSRVVTAN